MKRPLFLLLVALATACKSVPPPPPAPVHVIIVGTTDVHGRYDGQRAVEPASGGVPLLASYVDALRASNGGRVLVVDSGDLFQGTLESNFFEGEPVVHAYNIVGYAAAAVGNHEFDYGPVGPVTIARAQDDPLGALKRNAGLAKFPFLSANMKEKTSGKTPSWAKPYTIVETGGVRIGIIGISTPDTPNVTVAANVRDLDFTDPVPATVDAARELRARGADAVIVIAHMGGRCRDTRNPLDTSSCERDQEVMDFLARLPQGTIDAYFAGHTHSQMRQIINGVPVLQASQYSVEFSTLDLWITHGKGVDTTRTDLRPFTMICAEVWSGTQRCGANAPAGATLVPRTFEGRTIVRDARVTAAIAPYLERVAAKRNESIGVTTAGPFIRQYFEESELGDVLADALRRSQNADIAFINSGGIRANLRKGPLVYGDVFETSPFDNYPSVVMMTGEQVIQALKLTTNGDRGVLQVSGIRYTYDAAKDADRQPADRDRLVSVTMADGSAFDRAKVYRVAMPDFLALGGDGLMPVMSQIPADKIHIFSERPLHAVLADLLRTFPQPLEPKRDGRITVLNQPASRQ